MRDPRSPRVRPLATLGLLCALTALAHAQDGPGPAPIGFAPAARVAQARAEAVALGVPSPEKARAWLRTLTEEPHVAGTPADHRTALFVRDKLREWGWSADLAEYEVLLNYPVPPSVTLEIVRPEARKLKVIEDPHPADKDSASPAAFPAFNGYGVTGDVAGQVVYANYGRIEDFAALEKAGVEVRGKIVLTRYGGLFRGLKVYNAQKRGAIGVLIYSDPADDGYGRGDVYPQGPYRPPSAIQRGSVQFLSHGPGDPTTPGVASIRGAKRLPWHPLVGFPTEFSLATQSHEAQAKERATFDPKAWELATGLRRDDYFATIPSLPLSYESAMPILEALGGPNVPAGWQGGLPLPYHMGPGPVEVHFAVHMDYAIRPIWNVIATIRGRVEPDRQVLLGNHRDAWVYGAVDPNSGTASTLEACRAIGAAVKAGWAPRRTLVYASWDGEEYGLVGSTEWAEDHASELGEKALLMLNVDSAVSGPDLDIDGIPSLRDLVLDAAAGVVDPRTGKSLRDGWVAHQRSEWAQNSPVDLDGSAWEAKESPGRGARFSPRLNALGSGSDYTAFVDHLGIPALDVNFGGRYGVYHSVYDNFYWMEKFCDPDFVIHATAARLYTLIAMRAAGADVAPLRFGPYGEALREHVDELRRTVARKARAIEPDSGKTPPRFEPLPAIVQAVRDFETQAEALDKATAAAAGVDGLNEAKLKALNDALSRVERSFLSPAGLPERPWFKHTIYAPGLTTGYASWPLPGVRKAIVDDDAKALATQADVLVGRIKAATAAMHAAEQTARDAVSR